MAKINDTSIPEGYKRCSKGAECKHPNGPILPATTEYFTQDKRVSSGLASQCKACDRAWRQANAEYLTLRRKKHYAENREHELQTNREYHHRNRDVIHKRLAEYRKTDAFKQSKRKNNQKTKTKEAARARARIVHNRKRGGVTNTADAITLDQWQRALSYFNGCCAVCGRQLNDLFGEHTAAADHWIPFSKGGTHGVDNMVPLCHGVGGCNNSKKDKHPMDWLTSRYSKRQAESIRQRIEEYFKWATT